MGSLLAIHTAPSSGPTRTPLQNILETSSLVHHKNPAVEGPVVSFIFKTTLLCFLSLLYKSCRPSYHHQQISLLSFICIQTVKRLGTGHLAEKKYVLGTCLSFLIFVLSFYDYIT